MSDIVIQRDHIAVRALVRLLSKTKILILKWLSMTFATTFVTNTQALHRVKNCRNGSIPFFTTTKLRHDSFEFSVTAAKSADCSSLFCLSSMGPYRWSALAYVNTFGLGSWQRVNSRILTLWKHEGSSGIRALSSGTNESQHNNKSSLSGYISYLSMF